MSGGLRTHRSTGGRRERAATQVVARAEEHERAGRFTEARAEYETLLHLGHGGPATDLALPPLVLRRIARCFVEEADFQAAEDCLDAAEAIAQALGDRVGVAHATNLRAIAAQQRGDLSDAVTLYDVARQQAQEAGAAALVAMLDQNLGTVANIQGNFDEARWRYRQSLVGYRALGMERSMTQVLNNLGMLYTDLGEWHAAESSFSEAVSAASRGRDLAGRLRAEANRVELYIARRRYRKARRLARRLLALATGPSTPWLGETYKHLGTIARERRDVGEAERCFRLALDQARARHDLLLTAETMREMGILFQRTKRNRDTLLALNEAHAIFARLAAARELSDVGQRVQRLEAEFIAIVRDWGSSIESADHYTQGHCERVANYACALARDIGMDEGVLLWFRMGALLHDVGKITVPSAVLNKTGPLTASESALMREHPARGEELISGIAFPWDIRPMIRHHHERWDGRGYPDRLGGLQIPLAARILCIADVFDALTSTRSYRAAYGVAEAAALMRGDSEAIFDPTLLSVFLGRTLARLTSDGRGAERAA